MGADFYIYIYLEIEHLFGTAYLELPIKRGFFTEMDGGYYDNDYDDEQHFMKEEYNRLYQEVIQLDLTPHPPMTLYEKGAFVSEHFETKYKPLLEIYLQKNLLKNRKYDNDPNYNSDDDEDKDGDQDS